MSQLSRYSTGISSTPLRTMAISSECEPLPTAWNTPTARKSAARNGIDTAMARRNHAPYSTVLASSMNACVMGVAKMQPANAITTIIEPESTAVKPSARFMRRYMRAEYV